MNSSSSPPHLIPSSPRLQAARSKTTSALCFRSSEIKLSAEAGPNRAFSGMAYNGGVMFPSMVVGGHDVTGPVVVDLDSLTIPSQNRPVLDDHDDSTDGLIGRTTSLAIENYALPVAGVIYTKKERAKKILSANDGGHQWQLSIGLDQFVIQRVPTGQTVRVNKQDFAGPLTVVRNAYLTDLSFVSVGGDDSTWASIAAKRARSKAKLQAGISQGDCEMDFNSWMASTYPDIDVATLNGADLQKYQDEYAMLQLGDEDEDEDKDLTADEKKAAVRAYRRKKARIAAAREKKPLGGDGASLDKMVERAVAAATNATRMEAARIAHIQAMANGDTALAEKAISDGTSAKDFELAVLRAGRTKPSGASTKSDDNEHLVLEAALLVHGGMDTNRVAKYFDEKTMDRLTAKKYRGVSLVEVADRLIRLAGVHYEGARNQQAHMIACRNANTKLEASGFTSMSLSSILENAADKVLIDAYQAVETLWQSFCAIRSLNDFKVHSQYALDPLSVFQKVGSQGDFVNLQFGDRKYSLQADSYGVRFKIDFQTWRNDDLGSINNRIATIGSLGASTIDQVVNMLLMQGINNTAMFHAQNRNYDQTSASVLGIAGLTFAETLWANQIRQNGTPLGIKPQQLMVGTALKTLSGQLFTSQKLNEVFTTAQTRTGPAPSDNPFVGRYSPTTNPYFNNTLLKNNTGATQQAIPHQDNALWMLLARQGNNAPFHVGFLDGMQSPKIEIIQNQSEMIGFELAAGMHFGVGYGDPLLASAFNPNAA